MKVFLIFSALLLVAYAQHEYIGCYTDDAENRDLSILQVDDSDTPTNNTVDSCVFLCGRDEWPYAGLQGSDCYCGFVFGSLGKLADADCKSKCPGDESTDDATRQYPYCGNTLKNAIYSTGAPVLDTLDLPTTETFVSAVPAQTVQAQTVQTQTQTDAQTQASLAAHTQAALAALAASSQSQSSQSQSSQSQSSQSQSSQSQSSQSQSSQSQSSQFSSVGQPATNQNFWSQVSQTVPAQNQPLSAPVQNPVQSLPALNPPTDPFVVSNPGNPVSIPAVNKPLPPLNVPVPPKPQVPVTVPKPPTPKPPTPAVRVLCPICPYKKDECGGATRGTCNRQTGNCQCINGWSGGACGGRNGKAGAAAYGIRPTPGTTNAQVKCPICPYKRDECGGPTRGTCNKQTGECVCIAPYSGGACSNRPGRVGAPGYNRPTAGGAPKPKPAPVAGAPKPAGGAPRPNTAPTAGGAPKPKPAGSSKVLCPICPYKKEECGGATRGTCNRQTGNCECINGWAGGACGGRNGKTAAASYGVRPTTPGAPPAPAAAVKCPICPYKKDECGGPTRGTCNKQTGECVCIAPYSGGACSNRPGRVGAPGYNRPTAGGAPKPAPVAGVPKPAPKPKPAPVANAKCPICPYRREECGGAARGSCNRQTGECVCKTGYSGGACSNHNGRVGAAAYQTGKPVGGNVGVIKCPVCPYRREECGGASRGTCNRQTGNCQCINGWAGGACGGKNGKIGIAAYNRATEGGAATFNGNGASDSTSKMWMTSVGVLGAVVVVLFAVVIVLVVKLNAKADERV